MSLRSRRLAALRTLLGVLAALTFAGATLTLALVDESRDLRATLCTLVAVAAGITTLVSVPATRPVPALSGRRRRGTAWLGRLLVRASWLLRVVVNGAAAGYVAWNTDSDALQPLAAALVALSMVLASIGQLGQLLAGFVTAVDRLRGSGLARRAAAIALAAATAAVSGYLSAAVEHFRSVVTDPVWEFLREGWGLPAFLAGVVVALMTLLAVTVAASLLGVAMLSLASVIGPGTRLGRWLVQRSPIQFLYNPGFGSARVHVVGYAYFFSRAADERSVRWIYSGVRDSSGPLDPLFLGMLVDDVVRAAAELAPGRDTDVVLRAVGDHEEILLEHPSGDDGGAGGDGPGTRLLHDFPEAAALRRIRLALPDVELGLPSQIRCTTRSEEHGRALQRSSSSAREPAWFTEPGHEDLVKEVVRYPPAAPWVRERLGLPAVDRGW